MIELLKQLEEQTKCSFSIDYNPHKDEYLDLATYLYNAQLVSELDNDDTKYFNEIIKKNKLYVVRVYPNTPVGFNEVYHYDLELAIKELLK